MEIRKILNILESGSQFQKLSKLKEQPTSDQVATAALNKPAGPQTNALGVAAQANVPTFGAPATGTAKPAGQAAQPAPAQKTYGGGYDPSKVQYAYSGGKPTAPPPPSANLDAAKKAAFSGTTPSTQPASAAASANLDAAKTAAIGGSPAATAPAAPDTRGAAAMASKSATTPTTPTPDAVSASPSGGGAVAAFGKTDMANAAGGTATPAPAPTATADTSGATKGIPAAFGRMAEDELEEDQDSAKTTATNPPNQQQKNLPSIQKIIKADRKEIDAQFEPNKTEPNKKPYESPYNKDSKAINPGSKVVNTIDDFEESIDHELAEMLRLSGFPIMEKAVSRQQQKFMGMVHAMQKGEKVKGASPELKKAAKGMSKKDARDFASTKHKGLPKKVNEGLNLMLDEDGHTLTHIVNRYKHEVRKFIEGDFMPENLYDALYDYYLDRGDMPYGVAKGREGDPYQWVSEHFYDDVMRDLGNGMNEAVHTPVIDETLNDLAKLAGLQEDGPGQFGMGQNKTMRSWSQDEIEQDRAHSEFMDKTKRDSWKNIYPGEPYPGDQPEKSLKNFFTKGAEAYKDLYMTGLGMPPDKYTPADSKKPFGPKKSEVKEEGLTECGDMDMEQRDSFNVSTNMSSDGNKSVNITAQGAKADELLQMLKMAGMRPHDDHDHSTMSEPEIIMIGNDEMMEQELEEAKRRTTRYSNTPDEEYQSVKSITDQGADLNRQKRQYAGKPRLGDNPMAESALDYDLNEILESILIRDDQDRPEIKKDPETGRVSATYPAPKKPDQSQLPLPSERESRVSGPRTFKVDGERTGTEDYKQDDESEIYEEEPKTWLQRQPDRLPGEKSWDERVKDSDPNYVIPAERPYKDEKGRTVTPPRGATNPPADSPYPPGDRRNMQPSKRK